MFYFFLLKLSFHILALTGSQVFWTIEVNSAFLRIEEGYENGLKDYFKKAVGQLNALIEILLTDISPLERQKIETICTIDVHARDIVAKMIQSKVKFYSFDFETIKFMNSYDI